MIFFKLDVFACMRPCVEEKKEKGEKEEEVEAAESWIYCLKVAETKKCLVIVEYGSSKRPLLAYIKS